MTGLIVGMLASLMLAAGIGYGLDLHGWPLGLLSMVVGFAGGFIGGLYDHR